MRICGTFWAREILPHLIPTVHQGPTREMDQGRASPIPALPDPSTAAPNIDPELGFTAQDLIDHQERLEAQANEAFPYHVDVCTHTRGYVRQLIYACKTCGGGGVCVGCSVSCHSDHDLVELFHRRHFRCDCGTPNLYRHRPMTPYKQKTGYPEGAKPCSLRLHDSNKGWDIPNDENVYTKNFDGQFCVCQRGQHYDPETEKEDMFQCLVCEEWLHESCTSLYPKGATKPLISQDDFDTMICDACVRKEKTALLQAYLGQPGWLVVLPIENGWEVVGSSPDLEILASRKRARLDSDTCQQPTPLVDPHAHAHRMDVYLSSQFRQALCRCAGCTQKWQKIYPFVFEEEETYEPSEPEETDDTNSNASTSSSYDRAVAALSHLPRMQMIESLHAYQNLRDALFDHLRPYAENHELVSEETVRAFFEQHLASRRERTKR